jgi:hypothetical protein
MLGWTVQRRNYSVSVDILFVCGGVPCWSVLDLVDTLPTACAACATACSTLCSTTSPDRHLATATAACLSDPTAYRWRCSTRRTTHRAFAASTSACAVYSACTLYTPCTPCPVCTRSTPCTLCTLYHATTTAFVHVKLAGFAGLQCIIGLAVTVVARLARVRVPMGLSFLFVLAIVGTARAVLGTVVTVATAVTIVMLLRQRQQRAETFGRGRWCLVGSGAFTTDFVVDRRQSSETRDTGEIRHGGRGCCT